MAEAYSKLNRESFIYYGDSANAPYGTKKTAEVKKLSLKAANFLLNKGIKALVVACNTATSAAVNDLREWLDIPVIGMEPALKPAVEMEKKGQIVVMATPVTLREKKFQLLLEKYQNRGNIIPLSCPGLVELIEKGYYYGKPVQDYLTSLFSPLDTADISVIVLGCTHYSYIKPEVEKFKPGVSVIDGNSGTVNHLIKVLREKDLFADGLVKEPRIKCYTSADPDSFLPLGHHLFNFCLTIRG